MITKLDFEKLFAERIGKAITDLQKDMEKHGIRFEVSIDWQLTEGDFYDPMAG